MSEDIYSMQRSAIKNGISTFLVNDVGGDNIDWVSKMLAGIPHAADKAIGSAIKRAARSGEAYAARAVRNEYLRLIQNQNGTFPRQVAKQPLILSSTAFISPCSISTQRLIRPGAW